jgi:virginiamycin B lyase
MTEFPLPAGSLPQEITTAPDGSVWFTEAGTDSLGQITDSNGTIVQHPLAPLSGPGTRGLAGIAPGPGGIWFTERTANKIGQLTSNGQLNEYTIPATGQFMGTSLSTSGPFGITQGPDGSMWFTIALVTEIGHITPSGSISFFPLPPGEIGADLVTGPDGNVWIAIDPFSATGSGGAGRMTTSGAFKLFSPAGGASPTGITVGPDGRLWYADSGNNADLAAVTTGGQITVITNGIPSGSQPIAINSGPDGRIWFTLAMSNQIGAITP